MARHGLPPTMLSALGLVLAAAVAVPATPGDGSLRAEIAGGDVGAVRARGPAVMDELARLYAQGDVAERTRIARTLYALSWKSEAARRALMEDVRTENVDLRLQVQWALGRVSDDPEVVEVLLDNMRHDASPLFRDKAACALTYDQVHLSPPQQVRVYAGLIAALDDPEPQVRAIALQSLRIRTGQDKGYRPGASPEERRGAVQAWRAWLVDFRHEAERADTR